MLEGRIGQSVETIFRSQHCFIKKFIRKMVTLHFIATAIDNKVNTKSYKRGK